MAGTREASTVQSEKKRIKSEEEEDRISDLPDCLIQRILSFLPSTNQAIRTMILSKRWLHLWTWLPILVFKSKNGMHIQDFSDLVDNALILYNCSIISKFVIDSKGYFLDDLRDKLGNWIDFAQSRGVKELILECASAADFDEEEEYEDFQYDLPKFLFNNPSLVKFKMHCCVLRPEIGAGKVNWASLKSLYVRFSCISSEGIKSVLSDSPVIEYLELRKCQAPEFEKLVIASKSLKTLCVFESCYVAIEISCPNLEKLELLGKMSLTCLELKDLPASVCATLDFETRQQYCSINDKLKWVKEFLLQVQHVQELKLGPWFLKILSLAVVKREPARSLNNKCLTMISPHLVIRQPAHRLLLLYCPLLEKLVIQLQGTKSYQMEGFVKIGKEFWELDGSKFPCLVSHLKTVEIVGLYDRFDNGTHNDLLKFVEFLLKNARMLEKVALLEYGREGMTFASEVCKKLSCIQKASPNVLIEEACLSMVDLHSDSSSSSSSGSESEYDRNVYREVRVSSYLGYSIL